MATPRIFVSMGTPYTEGYEAFRSALEDTLRTRCDVDPRVIGRNEYPDGSPLHKIRQVMSTCDGVIIVAYERKLIANGTERPGGEKEASIVGQKLTTSWNHIESAMAFTLGLPIHIIVQTGLHREGLIEDKIDWYVQEMDFTPRAFEKAEVVDAMRAWIEGRVKKTHARRWTRRIPTFGTLRPNELTIAEWIGGLATVLAALGAAFAAGVWAENAYPVLFGG